MNEILLISFSGDDRPGVTAAITKILARYNANVLDIGQAVIHSKLSLGMLVEIPNESGSSPVLKDILFCAHELDMQVAFQPISHQSYAEWVGAQGKERHIVTLLTRKLTSSQISELTAVAVKHKLNFDVISRLTGRVPLTPTKAKSLACIEFSARGESIDLPKLHADFMELSSKLDVDIAVQEDNMYRRNRRLVCFDMDSTLIETEVIDELAKVAGIGDQVGKITEAAMNGEIDFTESFTRRMALLKGLKVEVLEGIAKKLPITEGARHLMKMLRKLGYKTAIISGGFTYFANHLQKILNIDYVYANELDIVDGAITGQVKGKILDGPQKAVILKSLAEKENISLEQVIAVGDGANDLHMLSIAGLGIAFRAKPLVKASAEHSISTLGLDAILYLMGYRDRDEV